MLKSLRSRLLLSYTVVIMGVLMVIAVAALVIGSLPVVRYVPTLRELDAISRVSRSEILRIMQTNASDERVLEVLELTAAESDVRVLVAQARDRQVIYDSNDNEWVGVTIEGI